MKKKYIILLVIVFIIMIAIIIATKNEETKNTVAQTPVTDETKDPEEQKVIGYHLVTYNQKAKMNSYVKNLIVTASNPATVEFVIGTIDENDFVVERTAFTVECKKGKNSFDLLSYKYLVKEGEYLFMDDYGQDIVYTQENSKVSSLVQTEENMTEGKMKIMESSLILPFEYTLEEIKEYNILVVGNDITTKDGGKGLNATEDYLDYYSLIEEKIGTVFEESYIDRINAKEWEEAEDSSKRLEWLSSNLTNNVIDEANLVLIQLGDNYPIDKIDDFEEDVQNLVDQIREYSPSAEIIWIGPWNTDEKILIKMPTICEKLDVRYIKLNDLYTDEYKSSVIENISGEETEKFYPNNEAMQLIANRIIEVLGIGF